jgi:hypothetical protein
MRSRRIPPKNLAYFFQELGLLGFEPRGRIILYPIKINNEYQVLPEEHLNGKPSPTRSTTASQIYLTLLLGI